jgi:hypothetical protein
MAKKTSDHNLGARERQIMDVIYQLGEASVAEVRDRLPNPPSYSAVRTMIRHLEGNGLLKNAAILDVSAENLDAHDFKRIEQMIEQARKEGQ